MPPLPPLRYFPVASAAWRYSGKVTGPDSRLSRPTVIGLPVALFSVPSAADASGVDVAAADESSLLAFDDESSPPHAAKARAHAANAARMPIQFFMTFMSLLTPMVDQAVAGTAAWPR